MQRNQIDECFALAGQLGELRSLLRPIVDAAKHHVLEGNPPVEDFRGVDHAGERILGIDRHQRLAQLVTGCMNGDRQSELLGALAEGDDSRQYSNGGDRDVARADSEGVGRVENGESRIDRFPIHERLAHPHEDDVGHLLGRRQQAHLAHLSGDLEHLEIARKAHRSRSAESAL